MEEIRRYELYLVFRPELDENGLEGLIERVDSTLTRNDGEIVEIVRRGKRRLQYPIEQFNSGIDVIYQANLPTSLLSVLERQFNLSEDVLRYLIVRRDDLQKEERLVQSEAEIEATVAELTAETSEIEQAAEAAARGEEYESPAVATLEGSDESADAERRAGDAGATDDPEPVIIDPTTPDEVEDDSEIDQQDQGVSVVERSSADEPVNIDSAPAIDQSDSTEEEA